MRSSTDVMGFQIELIVPAAGTGACHPDLLARAVHAQVQVLRRSDFRRREVEAKSTSGARDLSARSFLIMTVSNYSLCQLLLGGVIRRSRRERSQLGSPDFFELAFPLAVLRAESSGERRGDFLAGVALLSERVVFERTMHPGECMYIK